eukprot:229671-Amorphochlora_amoeboformis.AAC.1
MAAAEGASGGLLAFQEDIVESLESEDSSYPSRQGPLRRIMFIVEYPFRRSRGGLAVMAMGLGARNIVQELVGQNI